ncbi:MAG: helix-turn-helix transcriptional regulator [Candidatus Gastranaerophilales bacterium]|nr:helix-turn-helix transcriptional regulator [Candidatus Gastranaerophilales bacterium]
MNKEFVAKVAKNIKALREKKGISQLTLALEIGVTPGAIGNLEIAKNDTSLSRLYDIARVLGVEPYELLKFDE